MARHLMFLFAVLIAAATTTTNARTAAKQHVETMRDLGAYGALENSSSSNTATTSSHISHSRKHVADAEPWRSIEPIKTALDHYQDVLYKSRWIWTSEEGFRSVVVMSRTLRSGYTWNTTLVVIARDLVMIELFDMSVKGSQNLIMRTSIGGTRGAVGEFNVPLFEDAEYELRFTVVSFVHADTVRGLLFVLFTPMGDSIASSTRMHVWSRA